LKLAVVMVGSGMLFVWAFGLARPGKSPGNLLSLALISFAYYVIVKWDPLEKSSRDWKSVRFYQRQFPSLYIRDRCQVRCAETKETCRNYIKPGRLDHTYYWFRILHGQRKRDDPEEFRRTFECGSHCKFVFGMQATLGFLLALGLVVMLLRVAYWRLMGGYESYPVDRWEMVFAVGCFVAIAVIRGMHKPDEMEPEGCWRGWRDTNQRHMLWLRQHEDALVDEICNAGGNTTRFRAKA